MTQASKAAFTAVVVFDIDGVVRDVSGSYRRALADTVEHFTQGAYRPSSEDMDALKSEGIWNNDWEASQELICRYSETQEQNELDCTYEEIVAFFQGRYRGPDPNYLTGYICQEPLLMSAAYIEQLSQANIGWGFFSGATRISATYVLQARMGLKSPLLVAMEDAPGKPDPTGLLQTVEHWENQGSATATTPVFYVGDTVADMQTIAKAQQIQPDRAWLAVGILPPHVQTTPERREAYATTLKQAGAIAVFEQVEQLTPDTIRQLMGSQ
ncbi:TIGR01548 family HAD-type hydrolase [Trichocoleus sp. FACHB-591]|uniref:TIGR01548 family HAD-type hydrolase n=1 Tax=Trichocoleus sp. FACHB-591 TaxID=2692872 RepID=UPI0016864545|nr:TIGR01548 family HAD-type hydrolase [Trichocoleus sp. FACHB-591]MBD2094882.1 TIGR01548 family HAD-type hydrolase [Trichocoleus sp. FACHB-591]